MTVYEKLHRIGIPVIDTEGFRANVGIIICNKQGQVMWAKRYGQHSWQFPQGGIDEGESPEQAMYRELHEEVGLQPKDVELLGVTRNWIRYKLPKRFIRPGPEPVCIGQKQKWFLLKLKCPESEVDVLQSSHPEFDGWRWVSYWYPIRNVVNFKREVYRRSLKELLPLLNAMTRQHTGQKRYRPRRKKRHQG
jgi:putative (di)nucleoside polyphosphate hydrolase